MQGGAGHGGRHDFPFCLRRNRGGAQTGEGCGLRQDVKIGGGVSTVRQYMQAGLVDEMRFAISRVMLGKGETMFAGIDLPSLGYRVAAHEASGDKNDKRVIKGAGVEFIFL